MPPETKISSPVMKAGAAKIDITTDRKGAVINDPLYARVLVLDNGRRQVVLIGMDTTAIGGRRISRGALGDVSEEFLPRLRGLVRERLGIPEGNVLVNASHTHPPGRMLCGDEEQVERVFRAVGRAAGSMTGVRVGSGIGREDRITVNRTLRLKNGGHWTVRHANPCPPDDEVAGVGPVDSDIGLIRVDRADGSPLAAVFNFACHPLAGTGNEGISAYLPGFAARVMEEQLGCGAVALFLQGAGGDAVDIHFKDTAHPRNTEPLGMMLALSALRALRGVSAEENSILNAVSESVRLPRRKDIPERVRRLKREQKKLLASLRFTSLNLESFLPLYLKYKLNPEYPSDYAYRYLRSRDAGRDEFTLLDELNRKNIRKYIENIRAMEKLTRIQDDISTLEKHRKINSSSGEDTIAAEVQGIRIGDCVLITSPAELLAEIGLRIKKASPYRHTFISAFTNGYIHYGPPASYYGGGGYEVTECLLGPEWQEIYERKALEVIGML